MRFLTNIYVDGNLGVGTSTPSANFEVTGSVKLSGLSQATQNRIVVSDNVGNIGYRNISDFITAITNNITSAVNTITSVVNGVSANTSIVNSLSTNINAGNISITVNGVTSLPAALPTSSDSLQTVTGRGNETSYGLVTPFLITKTELDSSLFQIRNDVNSLRWDYTLKDISSGSISEDLELTRFSNAGVPTSVYYINRHNGNFGINNNNPAQSLDVTGTITSSAGYRVNDAVATTGTYLRGNGTNFVASTIQLADLPSLTGNFWSLNGNIIASKKTIGSIDAFDIGFITNNTEKMTILSNGNIGVGLTNPSSLFHISQNSFSIPVIKVDNNGTNGTTAEFYHGASTEFRYTLKLTSPASTTYFDTRGYLGLGVTPSYIIHAKSTEAIARMEATSTTGGSAFDFINPSQFWRVGMNTESGSSNNFHIRNVTNSNYFTIKSSNGEVGIGTLTPDSKFHVVSSTGAGLRIGYLNASNNYYDGNIHYFRNTGGTVFAELTSAQFSISAKIWTSVGFQNSLFTTDNNIVAHTASGNFISMSPTTVVTNGNGWLIGGNTVSANSIIGTNAAFDLIFRTNSTEQARFLVNGRFGIGTNNPTAKLHVSINEATLAKFSTTSHANTWNTVSVYSDAGGAGFFTSTLTGWYMNDTYQSLLIAGNGAGITFYSTGLGVMKNLTLSTITNGVNTDSLLTIDGTGSVRKLSIGSVVSTSGWSLTGNAGTIPSTNFIGTTDAQDVVIRSNNTERMRIFSDGGITIGSSSTPLSGYRLDIHGGAIIRSTTANSATIYGYNTSTSGQNYGVFGQLTEANASGWGVGVYGTATGATSKNTGIIGVASGGTSNIQLLLGTSAIPTGNFGIYNTSTSNNYIEGNVGIGTSAPTTKLHIEGNTNATSNILLKNTHSGSSAIAAFVFGNNANNLGSLSYTSTTHTIPNSMIYTGDNHVYYNTSGVERMRILANGNIGIGTIPSSANLHINTSNFNSTVPALQLSYTNSVFAKHYMTDQWTYAIDNSNTEVTGGIVFRTASTDRMFIDRTGNVGIGTLSPTFKLDVISDIRVNSVIIGRGGSNSSTNISIGSGLVSNTGINNMAIGPLALNANTSGLNNSALGHQALSTNTTGQNNTGLSYRALYLNQTGNNNAAFGAEALYTNVSGNNNAAVGYQALKFTTGSNNVGIGYYAAGDTSTGSDNTAIGNSAMYNNTTGSNNICIGNNSITLSATGSNQISIGNVLYRTSSGLWGLETNNPLSRFHIVGTGNGTVSSPFRVTNASAKPVIYTNDYQVVGIATSNPKQTFSVQPLHYSTGTVVQSGSAVTGTGTTFTATMKGMLLTYADGTDGGYIVDVVSATVLIVSTSQTIASTAYSIEYSTLQATNNGKVGIGVYTPTAALHVKPVVGDNTLILEGLTSATDVAGYELLFPLSTGVIRKGSFNNFQIQNGKYSPYVKVSANYTVVSGDSVISVENEGSNVTITFPAANVSQYRVLTVKRVKKAGGNISTGTVTITPTANVTSHAGNIELLNGSFDASVSLTGHGVDGSILTYISNGSEWELLSF